MQVKSYQLIPDEFSVSLLPDTFPSSRYGQGGRRSTSIRGQSAAEFYIVQDTATKRCTIVEQKPTTQTTVVVGGGRTYTTRQEAEGAMKTVKV